MDNTEFDNALREMVGIAIGQASMCWNPHPGDQVFDSETASRVADSLIEDIMNLLLYKEMEEFHE